MPAAHVPQLLLLPVALIKGARACMPAAHAPLPLPLPVALTKDARACHAFLMLSTVS